jgi:hypothetical protein
LPGITFIRYKALKGGQSYYLSLLAMVLEGASQLRNVRESSFFCEKTTDFQLGVNSFLEDPK